MKLLGPATSGTLQLPGAPVVKGSTLSTQRRNSTVSFLQGNDVAPRDQALKSEPARPSASPLTTKCQINNHVQHSKCPLAGYRSISEDWQCRKVTLKPHL